jgi:hypothetical protein
LLLLGRPKKNLESIPNRFGATPVLKCLPDGNALALPWRS